MGTDFRYQYANSWFRQMDKFIHYVNQVLRFLVDVKNVLLEFLVCIFNGIYWFISFWVEIHFVPPYLHTLRMGVSMHFIQHHLSTLMQNMRLMSNGLLKLMISFREFFLGALVIDLCLTIEVRGTVEIGKGKWKVTQTFVLKIVNRGKERNSLF